MGLIDTIRFLKERKKIDCETTGIKHLNNGYSYTSEINGCGGRFFPLTVRFFEKFHDLQFPVSFYGWTEGYLYYNMGTGKKYSMRSSYYGISTKREKERFSLWDNIWSKDHWRMDNNFGFTKTEREATEKIQQRMQRVQNIITRYV